MRDKVYGTRRTSCKKLLYPRHAVCPECGGEEFEPVEIEGEGKVLTYTDVYALAIDYETRYLRVAIVEFDDGLRATGQLEDQAPQIGKRVKATVGTVRQSGDQRIEGLIFVPA